MDGTTINQTLYIKTYYPTRLPVLVAWGNTFLARRVKEKVVLDGHKQVSGCQRLNGLFQTGPTESALRERQDKSSLQKLLSGKHEGKDEMPETVFLNKVWGLGTEKE